MATVIRGTDNSVSAPAISGNDGDTGVYFPAANQVALATNGTQAMLADDSQRIGFSATPSAWWTTNTTPVQVRKVSLAAISNYDTHITTNAYYDGSSWRYIDSGVGVSNYFQNSGGHLFRGAASGTAGNAISYSTLMDINSSGQVVMPTQPIFFGYNPAGGLTSGSDMTTFNVQINIGSHFNNTNGRFTAPVAGRYEVIWAALSTDSVSTVFRYTIHVNGSAVYGTSGAQVRLDTNASGSEYAFGSRTIYLSLSANDYINLRYGADNGNNAPNPDWTTFGVRLVS